MDLSLTGQLALPAPSGLAPASVSDPVTTVVSTSAPIPVSVLVPSSTSASTELTEREKQEKQEKQEKADELEMRKLTHVGLILGTVGSVITVLVGMCIGLYKRHVKVYPRTRDPACNNPETASSLIGGGALLCRPETVIAEAIAFANYTPSAVDVNNLFSKNTETSFSHSSPHISSLNPFVSSE